MPVAGKCRHGFTLVETLFAAVVFVIAAMGLTATMAQGGNTGNSVRERQAADNAVDAVFARMGATPFHELASRFHGKGFAIEGLRAREGDDDGLPGEVSLAYGTDQPDNYYIVTIRARWTGHNGERLTESVRYLANVFGEVGIPVALEQIDPGGEIEYAVDTGSVTGGGEEPEIPTEG